MARARTPMHVSFNHLFIMAKVVNGGNKKGKVGSSIFYTIKNSNNKVTQGERIYQPNVTNPQSESQRAQRMKMRPATNFYAALSGILDHSFQGVKYGAMSRQYFLQQAIGKTQEVFPYLLKGENKFVPGPYLMSKGSLSSISYSLTDDGASIKLDDYEPNVQTIGNISTGLMNINTTLREGDQITFIMVQKITIDSVSNFVPFVCRFLIDTSSEELFEEVATGWSIGTFGADDWKPAPIVSAGLAKTAAFCVIVSRKNISGGEVWQRSTERMLISDRVYNMYMSPDAYADALESYKRTAASYDSDYYLNDAETPDEVGGVENYSFTNASLDFTLGSATETHTAVLVQGDNGPIATCAKFGVSPDETPDGKNTWLETYIVRGRKIVLLERYSLKATEVKSITAKYNNQVVQVLTPEAFVARFKDFTIA